MLNIASAKRKPIKYPSYVKSVQCDCYSFLNQNRKTINIRTSLVIKTTNNTNKVITYVLKNPSKADKFQSDLTINKVIAAAYNKGAEEILIFNVLPFYLTDSNQLITYLNELMENDKKDYDDAVLKNYTVIEKYLTTKSEDVFICGWGSNTTDAKNLENIEQLIKKHRVKVNKFKQIDDFPIHPQGKPIDKNDPFEPLDL
ncbi:DUF1643 domain-containing protein [Bacillus sp. FSL M8-0350]|uniref:DUF1643 domain-containing protein n=1 Tax=Bacillus sp. FSL M8-0350 TaxID=2954579 RepID=UPI00315ACF54